MYFRAVNKFFFILICFCAGNVLAQKEVTPPVEQPPYNRKEEIIFDGKRYRIHNNYVTLNLGFLESTIREQGQKTAGLDYHFHIRRQYFQVGGMISGEDFLSNNNNSFHIGYGYRIEKNTANLAFYGGPTYFKGVEGIPPAPAMFYDGFGLYLSGQAIYKVKYDVGLGLEVFGEFNYKQIMAGFKIALFFSGGYRGVKKKYNPNVRSENPNMK